MTVIVAYEVVSWTTNKAQGPNTVLYTYSTVVILGFSKHPRLQETDLYVPQTAVSVAMLKADRPKRGPT